MDLSPQKIRWILIYLFVLLISVALHEFGHAIVAYKLGDDTPRRQGRVTLNPLAHADPVGTFFLPLVSSVLGAASGFGIGGFGWGRPVQWQPHRVSRKISMSLAKILVSLAGPTMNLVLATVIVIINVVLLKQGVISPTGEVGKILPYAVRLNFVLFFFNLLPIPPLDGGHIVQSFLPYRHREAFDSIARFSPFLLLAIMATPQLGFIVAWPAVQVAGALYHLFGVTVM